MPAPRPAAEPIDITPISIAAGLSVIAALCVLAVIACARAYGGL